MKVYNLEAYTQSNILLGNYYHRKKYNSDQQKVIIILIQ